MLQRQSSPDLKDRVLKVNLPLQLQLGWCYAFVLMARIQMICWHCVSLCMPVDGLRMWNMTRRLLPQNKSPSSPPHIFSFISDVGICGTLAAVKVFVTERKRTICGVYFLSFRPNVFLLFKTNDRHLISNSLQFHD